MKNKSLTILLLFSYLTITASPPEGYYNSALDKKQSELKTSLFYIISSNAIQRSYYDLWKDMRKTDARDDGKVWDMYSNCNFTFGTDQDRGEEVYSECGKYNREHSIPNSWFGGEEYPMYTDLFHLYPTDKYVNAGRSNNPYGETNSPNKTFNNGSKLGRCTFSGYTGTVFEPIDEYKGDFARTYFYFVTRYQDKMSSFNSPNFAKNTYPSLSNWTIEMLIKWHRNDPVSKKETDRNEAVCTIQKNRNPFIDHPELVEHIWGTLQNDEWNSQPPVIITQLYGGGGNKGATYKSDFIELYNNTSTDLDISGWSLQYASSTGTSFSTTNVFTFPSNTSIKGQRHFAVKCADGQGGIPWTFTFDASTTVLQLSGSAGKVALMKNATPITLSSVPSINDIINDPNFVDYVPYGTATIPVWGTPFANTTNTQSLLRKEIGGKYKMTNDIGSDFTTATPNPRNSSKGTTSVQKNPTNNAIKAIATPAGVIISGAPVGSKIQIYSPLGSLIKTVVFDNNSIYLQSVKGMYLIKVDQQIIKVIR